MNACIGGLQNLVLVDDVIWSDSQDGKRYAKCTIVVRVKEVFIAIQEQGFLTW